MREAIRRPIGDERARLYGKNSKILVKILSNPSIILPCAIGLCRRALLGAPLARLGRLLAEKVALQEAFQKR